MLFCIYWDDCMIFIIHSINMAYHIYWFMNVEPFLEKFPLDHGVCFFYCAVEFGLLIFWWELLHLWSSGMQSCSFFAMTVSGFGVRVILVSWNELRIFLLPLVFWKSLKRVVISSFLFSFSLLTVLDLSCSTQDLRHGA